MPGIALLLFLAALPLCAAPASAVHVWEKQELTLEAQGKYANPYTDVEVWIDLKGPNFAKRVYGFWDGGQTFRVRYLATAPGEWTWKSGSSPSDAGLSGRTGKFTAVPWTEAEKLENPARRGFIRPTANGHAFEYADGEPYFYMADTWWTVPTFRHKWHDDDDPRPTGPGMGIKDMVRLRKAQGFNGVILLASFPTWAADGHSRQLEMKDGTAVRSAWGKPGTETAKDMHNEGGRPFFFPGKVPGFEDVVPDYERINPAYFQHLDKKIDYLNSQGFIPFIEAARRDVSQTWKKYYEWPLSYARYVQYLFARYQANNCLYSPIHFDYKGASIPSREYNAPANLVIDRWGAPPFGTLVSANANPSTTVNFGGPDEARWLTFHQTGNLRQHDYHWDMVELFYSKPTRPAIAGEPYYSGLGLGPHAPGDTPLDNAYCRSSAYGKFLSGGLGGYVYGVAGMWGGDIHPGAKARMWEVLNWGSAAEFRHLRTFAFSQGTRFQDLEPIPDLVSPNKAGPLEGYLGWAYCSRTPDQEFFLLYWEKDAPLNARLRGAKLGGIYEARWFDPRQGVWSEPFTIKADGVGKTPLPERPSSEDWALSLVLTGIGPMD